MVTVVFFNSVNDLGRSLRLREIEEQRAGCTKRGTEVAKCCNAGSPPRDKLSRRSTWGTECPVNGGIRFSNTLNCKGDSDFVWNCTCT
jgi:hypothetical protein